MKLSGWFLRLSLAALSTYLTAQTGAPPDGTEETTVFQRSNQAATYSGYVLDGSSGEGLPGANVYFEGTGIGAATNVDGYFVLANVPAGRYTLRITYLGFEAVELPLELRPGESLRRDFELRPQPLSLEEVQVSGKRVERQTNVQMSRVKLNVRQLRGMPQVGEADLMRTLQALPGVLTTAEFSTGLVIRGGNTDQNLILLDGITVYNPSHLGGLFSSFILDVIKEADLIKGGFNAEYGDRLSAVLNVRSREGNQKHFDGKLSVSLLSAQSTLEGPIGEGAWVMAGRRTYFDQIFKGTDLYFPYYFYDLQGHVFQDLTDRDRVSFSWYVGRDNLLFDALGLSAGWGNQTFSGNYRKLVSSRLVSHWMLAQSRFDTRFDLGGDLGLTSSNIINDLTFQTDWNYFASQTTEFTFGTQVKDLAIGYKSTFLDSTIFNVNQSPLEGVVYGKVKRWVTPRLMVEPGLRVTYYDGHPTKWFFDPRFNVKYLLTPDRYLNGAVGLYHQFIETVQDDFNPSILDQWVAVDGSVEPASSVQVVLGYEEYVGNMYRIQVEGYYKTLNNMLTFIEQRATDDEILSSEKLFDSFDLASGYATGLEFFLQKQAGRLNGWLSYTYSVARKKLNGQEYYSNWDRRHAFNIVTNMVLSNKWELNWRWTYQSGQPYTPILGFYMEKLPHEPGPFYQSISGGRNSLRYPPYHRLDLGVIRHYQVRGAQVDLFLQVVNAYWRENIFQYNYIFGDTGNGLDDDGDDEIDEPDEGIPQRQAISIFPLLPSIGITIDF